MRGSFLPCKPRQILSLGDRLEQRLFVGILVEIEFVSYLVGILDKTNLNQQKA
jgi:hypothetical protein